MEINSHWSGWTTELNGRFAFSLCALLSYNGIQTTPYSYWNENNTHAEREKYQKCYIKIDSFMSLQLCRAHSFFHSTIHFHFHALHGNVQRWIHFRILFSSNEKPTNIFIAWTNCTDGLMFASYKMHFKYVFTVKHACSCSLSLSFSTYVCSSPVSYRNMYVTLRYLVYDTNIFHAFDGCFCRSSIELHWIKSKYECDSILLQRDSQKSRTACARPYVIDKCEICLPL